MKLLLFILALLSAVSLHAQVSCSSSNISDTTTSVICRDADGTTTEMYCNSSGCKLKSYGAPVAPYDFSQWSLAHLEEVCKTEKNSIKAGMHITYRPTFCELVDRKKGLPVRDPADDKRLELCDKGVFDKTYCDALHKRLALTTTAQPEKQTTH
jgi:hypothetical protein